MPRKTPASLWHKPISHWIPISRIWYQEKQQFERILKRPETSILMQIPEFFDRIASLREDDFLVNWNEHFDVFRDALENLIKETRGVRL
jgi:dephospho-CoA kinase